MSRRTRHSNDEVEKVLAEAEQHGWTVTLDGMKFKLTCGCGAHGHAIAQGGNPARRAAKNLRTKLTTCWR